MFEALERRRRAPDPTDRRQASCCWNDLCRSEGGRLLSCHFTQNICLCVFSFVCPDFPNLFQTNTSFHLLYDGVRVNLWSLNTSKVPEEAFLLETQLQNNSFNNLLQLRSRLFKRSAPVKWTTVSAESLVHRLKPAVSLGKHHFELWNPGSRESVKQKHA